MLTERIARIMAKHYVCDSCVGRQFGQLLSGFTNAERGRILRNALAMAIDAGQELEVEPSNFFGYKFRQNKDFEKAITKPGNCWVCDGLFTRLDSLAERVAKQLKDYDFNTFLVGTIVSRKLLEREEILWEAVGIETAEPLRAEINREIGKRLEKLTGKRADLKKPDIAVLVNLQTGRAKLNVNPLYIFGYYKKLVRGIPQASWRPYYKTSVQDIIAKPVMAATKGKAHRIHAAGREDVDARCLAWRPFVLEILKPKKRAIDYKKIIKQINSSKKVLVKSLMCSNMDTARKLKEASPDKSYRVLVVLDKAVKKSELKNLKKLVGTIHQRTPERVLHRRAELLRKREVKAIKWKFVNKKSFEMFVTGSSGLYIKELISGDNGRTRPSVSEVLGRKAVCKQLDVVNIGRIKI
ncbi:MAG: tRNA pseudouridine(54/55) synthase Pus10 [Candidatus Aenigmatarchaeota archaeon]|nr:tRNA pseudouridine(54/55) synthase Pus10 [Candidatus Aenigmarchaeota archaeon]